MSQFLTANISIEFKGYWHAGSGRGTGHHLDAICERDTNGLPYLPGKQLKGLLRQAVARAEDWDWFSQHTIPSGPMLSLEDLLFGSESQQQSRYLSQPGMLQVHSAELPEAERLWLAQPEQASQRQALFDELFSTAIDEETGSASNGSLRGIEVCLPSILIAEVRLQITALDEDLRKQQQMWLDNPLAWQVIEEASTLIDAVGAHRNRGLGEAQVRLLPVAQGV